MQKIGCEIKLVGENFDNLQLFCDKKQKVCFE